MPRSMPAQRPATSEQSVATPTEFLKKVKELLGIEDFSWDLAAEAHNSVAPNCRYFDEEQNSLIQPWHNIGGWCWLNPPFSDIKPWAMKAYEESRKGAKVAMLVPASTGSNWFREWVDGKAFVNLLNGRLTFVGHTSPYPKDCMLLLYSKYIRGGYYVWRWNEEE